MVVSWQIVVVVVGDVSARDERSSVCWEDDNTPSVGEVFVGVLDVIFGQFGTSLVLAINGVECICIDDGRSEQRWCGVWGVACVSMLSMASSPCRVVLERLCWCEKAWSYRALLAALPTLPKSCVVVNEHLPASFWAKLGSRLSRSKASLMVTMICRIRCGQGLIVAWDSLRCM